MRTSVFPRSAQRTLQEHWLLKSGAVQLSVSFFPLPNESRAVISFGAVVQDITEQNLSIQALAISEKRYRGSVESSGEGIYLCELNKPMSVQLPIDEQIHLLLMNVQLLFSTINLFGCTVLNLVIRWWASARLNFTDRMPAACCVHSSAQVAGFWTLWNSRSLCGPRRPSRGRVRQWNGHASHYYRADAFPRGDIFQYR